MKTNRRERIRKLELLLDLACFSNNGKLPEIINHETRDNAKDLANEYYELTGRPYQYKQKSQKTFPYGKILILR